MYACVRISSLIQELVELRQDLSQLLKNDLLEQRLNLQEAETTVKTTESVDDNFVVFAVVDSDLSGWLSDCADDDTIKKVVREQPGYCQLPLSLLHR